MKILLFSIIYFTSLFANPAPVLKCKYQDSNINLNVDIFKSSSSSDKVDFFQTNYSYEDSTTNSYQSDVVRYHSLILEGEELFFISEQHKVNFSYNRISKETMLCLGSSSLDSCINAELKCDVFTDLEKLKSATWDSY